MEAAGQFWPLGALQISSIGMINSEMTGKGYFLIKQPHPTYFSLGRSDKYEGENSLVLVTFPRLTMLFPCKTSSESRNVFPCVLWDWIESVAWCILKDMKELSASQAGPEIIRKKFWWLTGQKPGTSH